MLRPITFQYAGACIAAALLYVLQLKIDHMHTQFRFAPIFRNVATAFQLGSVCIFTASVLFPIIDNYSR